MIDDSLRPADGINLQFLLRTQIVNARVDVKRSAESAEKSFPRPILRNRSSLQKPHEGENDVRDDVYLLTKPFTIVFIGFSLRFNSKFLQTIMVGGRGKFNVPLKRSRVYCQVVHRVVLLRAFLLWQEEKQSNFMATFSAGTARGR